MARRVPVDPESRTATREPHGTKSEGLLFRLIEVVYGDIEMHLLRRPGVRPARRLKIRRQLEGQARPVGRVTDHDPVVVVLDSDEAEELLVKHCEPARVRRVDHKAMPPAGHRRSMSPRAAAPCRARPGRPGRRSGTGFTDLSSPGQQARRTLAPISAENEQWNLGRPGR
jgi:hypothetical protein